MTALIVFILTFAFFCQSLFGFGGGLISIPILSLFMPVQNAVTLASVFQISMGFLILRTYKDTGWKHIRALLPMTVIGVGLGIALLKYLNGDIIRLALAGYILLHLARTHTKFDPLGRIIKAGGAHLAGFLGGTMNAMIGGGGPAFILYLKDKASNPSEFRANITAILFLSNIPRLAGTLGTGLMTWDIFTTAMIVYPFYLGALVLGQKLHKKIPQKRFFTAIEVLLAFTALSLTLKALL
ncbi:MAG: sulfite exporter TauE/SafE family protein [Alphaproteobacteria bacterium]|nr:sulfite exporter TauE/SafE family protein [Alphaproteobacteria bacterium]MCB1839561.1 sulfite exporter TauE/SafE family protein [Alphaproteobacteria bacterium]